MISEEYRELLAKAAEEIFPKLPAHASARLDERMVAAVVSGWGSDETSLFAVSMIIAYSTYVDRSVSCVWSIVPASSQEYLREDPEE